MTTRRRFIEILPLTALGGLAGAAALTGCSDKAPAPAAPPAAPAPAPAPPPAEAAAPAMPATPPAAGGGDLPLVDPADPAAVALGYVADATRVDANKFKTFAAGQACTNCSLFAGAPGAASGPCPLFTGRAVAASGWCSAYARKTG